MKGALLILPLVLPLPARGSGPYDDRVAVVTRTPGLVAFWDLVRREPAPAGRFVAHVPEGATNDYALDAGNYVRDYWGQGRPASYADFPLLGRGPFGQAVRIRKEDDPAFRPFLFVPRTRLHDSPLDVKGEGRSVTVVVWAVRESGNHALAGIWHEGTDLKESATAGVRRVERGRRQYALFAGLNKEGSACGHVSENGAGSFAYKYAMHKCNSGDVSPAVPADAPRAVLDRAWRCFAMTFDHRRHEIAGWLDGRAAPRWEADVKAKLPPVYNAWLQGRLRRTPGTQPGEDPGFPADQVYAPPEDRPVAVTVVSDDDAGRVEIQEFGYTRVRVSSRRDASGRLAVVARDLSEVRLNPWWYPHAIYAPPDASSGGPFTIGRVIHNARSVGFTGWIGGVAVFDRALGADELGRLSALGRAAPLEGVDPR